VQTDSATASQETSRLLRSIADNLRLPLTAIARQAELGALREQQPTRDLQAIVVQATAALNLLDSYTLGLSLLEQQEQAALVLEPVSVSSLLTDAAHALDGLARQYDVAVALHIAGKYAPVMAHPAGLRAVLLSLGATLLENSPLAQSRRLTLAVHRTPHGIVTGLYGDFESLNTRQWKKALQLHGSASQPYKAVGGNSAGLFVADALLHAMASRLRVGRHLNQQGLAATLQTSHQLTFV
jgi:K+-sensing histidine kinase KdpD